MARTMHKAVHQFHSGSAYGDAVTNGMLLTRRLLRELGFESEIYVQHLAPELADTLHPHTDYDGGSDSVLLVRHSHGHGLEEWVHSLPDHKILLYHNITPHYFFPSGSIHHRYSQIGRQQLKRYARVIEAAISDSPYNALELRALGFRRVEPIPLLVDTDAVAQTEWDTSVLNQVAGAFTVLFVGRVAENKCQHHVLAIFARLCQFLDRPARLVLVGGYAEGDPYYQHLRQSVHDLGLDDQVHFTGKVSTEALYGWYRAAAVFLCMSEHEGFGVPLLEAMIFDVPVVAFRSSNVPYTLGNAGVQITHKYFDEVAAVVSLIDRDRAFRRQVLLGQRKERERYRPDHVKRLLADFLTREGIEVPCPPGPKVDGDPKPAVQIEGPFESTYSLAIVNRELALAFEADQPGSVALFCTEGPGDYQPPLDQVRAHPGVEEIWQRGEKAACRDVVIRNLYPPRVADMKGLVNLLYFAWEESSLPAEWVAQFNRHLDGMTVLSEYVKKVLLDAGVHVPIRVGGCGIEQVLRTPARPLEVDLGKGFRFLHVSSCFPRKGVDLLLVAYGQAFTADDDVTLVIKTFPNIHNTVEDQIADLRARYPACPHIVLINSDLDPGQLVELYHQCHAFVAPTRGEGFGLPMAEAMLFGLPVLTTGYGGQADFCTPDTSWPIDYRFDWAQTHLGTGHSVWLEPDPNHLVRLLRQVYSSPCPSDRLQRARALIEERFTWRQSVSRVQQTVASITAQAPLVRQPLRLAWVSSWNTKCGISSYSSYFLGSLPADDFEVTILSSRTTPPLGPDAGNVRRCWDDYTTPHLRDLERELLFGGYDVVVFQFNFGFFDLTSFANLLVRLYQRQITTVVTFHATAEVDRSGCRLSLADIGNALACADRLLVHGIKDLDYLRGLGLVENAVLFPHGVLERPVREVSEIRQALGIGGPIIATYGFLLPHKGIVETIEALPLIRQTHPGIHLLLVNALYPLPQSEQLRQECARRVQALGQAGHVTPIHEFLSDEETLTLLECADLVLFPYQNTAESSSAAVRAGLSSNRPVACTPMPIFDNVARVTHRLPGFTPLALGRGVSDLLSHPELLASKQEAQRQWVERHSWKGLAARLAGMLRGLHRDRANSAARPLGLVEKRADQRIASGREPMLRVA